MAGFLRFILGLCLLPACWAFTRTFAWAVLDVAAADGFVSIETLSLFGGMVVFSFLWIVVPHPIKTYVFGHELTHALWGLFFGAIPSEVKVGASGGSVRLTKTNVFITLAPYFFPFYTFVVILIAFIVYLFIRPLPWMPFWLFLVGFTWAFHVLFTFLTLTQRQPDVKLYGRIFSWAFIYLANLLIILLWLGAMTSLSFGELGCHILSTSKSAYCDIMSLFHSVARFLLSLW